jgi:transcriptional regulator with GAF, ATPase, and Fis domain
VEGGLRQAVLAATACESAESLNRLACDALANPGTALARVWLADADGDLRLAASAGVPTGGGSYHRIDGSFRRIARGVGKIGRIAATGEALVVRDVRGDEEWLTNPGWIARQGIRSFVGLPLAAEGRVLGVIALFSRSSLAPEALADLQFFASVIAIRTHALTRPEVRTAPPSPGVYTRSQLRELEKSSIEKALATTRGKIFGGDGAAALLEMRPTTLASRIKALGIRTGGVA